MRLRSVTCLLTIAIGMLLIAGCGPKASTPTELTAFDQAAVVPLPVQPPDEPQGSLSAEEYRVQPGDVLSLSMPQVMRRVLSESGTIEPYAVRVSQKGTISLPAAGEVQVAGKTLGEAEDAVANAYYPQQLRDRPSVIATVEQYHSVRIVISGAVAKPGLFELRSGEALLSAALAQAGGIDRLGARTVYVRRADGREVTVNVVGGNVPAVDVKLMGGEMIQVAMSTARSFSVTGLVKKPGEFEYPGGTDYNLVQAIGAAGGVDQIAGPEFVQIVRPNEQGQLVSAIVSIKSKDILKSGSLPIRPGDSIIVMRTSATDARTASFSVLSRIGFFVGASYDLNHNNGN